MRPARLITTSAPSSSSAHVSRLAPSHQTVRELSSFFFAPAEDNNLCSLGRKMPSKVAADEAAAAGDYNFLNAYRHAWPSIPRLEANRIKKPN